MKIDTPHELARNSIWFDGALTPWREAQLHVLTHGLHYGGAVFEGMRMYEGQIFAAEAHIARLHRSANLMDFELPFGEQEILAACRLTAAENGMTNCYLRPLAWRGSDQIGVSALGASVHVAIAVWEWPDYVSGGDRAAGIRLAMARHRRAPASVAPPQAKAAGHYMMGTVEKQAAERGGCADALILDVDGFVAETTGANVIFVAGKCLHTPRPDGILAGITRQTVFALAQGLGLSVVERDIRPAEFADFSEAMMVGTAVEVAHVSQIGDHRFPEQSVSNRLRAAYAGHVRQTSLAPHRLAGG